MTLEIIKYEFDSILIPISLIVYSIHSLDILALTNRNTNNITVFTVLRERVQIIPVPKIISGNARRNIF